MASIDDCTLNNPVEGSVNLCTEDIEYASYGYNVKEWTAYVFVALFAISTILSVIQALRARMWFMLFTVMLCGLDETIGWAARLWSALGTEWSSELGGYWNSPDSAFMAQISTLIIGPAFLSAGYYIILGRVVEVLGPQYCRIRPRLYAIIFVSGDVLSLVIQAAGGGIASGADDQKGADNGAHIMVGGVFLQMAVMIIFALVLVDFVIHYTMSRPVRGYNFDRVAGRAPLRPSETRKARILLIAVGVSTFLVFVRSVYRTIELLDGWDGPIITNQTLFCVLDAIPVFIATAIFNIIHPARFMPIPTEKLAPETDFDKPDGSGVGDTAGDSQMELVNRNYA